MSVHRYLDAVFYAVVNYIAYIPLVVYPFRHKFTFSKMISYSIIGILCLGFVGMTICVMYGMPAWLIPVITLGVTVCVMKIGIRERLGKTLTTFLIEYNNASFVTVIAKNVEILVFPGRAHQLYCWTHSVFILVGVLFVYFFDGIYSARVYNKIVSAPEENKAWSYIWMTPMAFFIIWFIYIYSSVAYTTGVMEKPVILLLMILFSICSFITYTIIIQLVSTENERARLLYQDQVSQFQYRNMNQRIEEARKTLHDQRQHVLIMKRLAQENNTAGILEYLNHFSEEVSDDNVLVYCHHYGINALLSYYASQAGNLGIAFRAKCSIPEKIPFSDKDMTIIFGNLVENAVMACKKVTGQQPQILIQSEYSEERMLLKIRNTTDQEPQTDGQGRYLSSSHKGYGIGLESVKNVVDSYQGYLKITCENGWFAVAVLISEREAFTLSD